MVILCIFLVFGPGKLIPGIPAADVYIINHKYTERNDTKPNACLECHGYLMDKDVKHAPALEDCESCHQPNGINHPGSSENAFSLVEKQPGLCYSCHSELNTKKYQHLPAREGECTTCHSPHSSGNKDLINNASLGEVCYTCHDSKRTPAGTTHNPVLTGKCNGCHDPHESDNPNLLLKNIPELCFSCHEKTKEEIDLTYSHLPFQQQCRFCHEPHSTKNKTLTNEQLPKLCYQCHKDIEENISEEKVVHKAVSEGTSCVGCHSPHASNNPNVLLYNGQKLCLNCHNKAYKSNNGSIENIKQKLEKEHVHGIIETEGCSPCHKPHTSENYMLLSESFPESSYTKAIPASFELCFGCHDSEIINKDAKATVTNFRDNELNLHYLHIQGDKGRSCTLCHDIHGSDFAHLIAKKVKFGNWEMPIEYTFTEQGGSCLTGCHQREEYTR
jgi:predicted CXXCH cytochrome family protein